VTTIPNWTTGHTTMSITNTTQVRSNVINVGTIAYGPSILQGFLEITRILLYLQGFDLILNALSLKYTLLHLSNAPFHYQLIPIKAPKISTITKRRNESDS